MMVLMNINLAEFQVRLLLCRPAEKRNNRLVWGCGCTAQPCAHRKYRVNACDTHASLFVHVREGEEPVYDFLTAPSLKSPRELHR